jgi:hypothetical protein
MMRFIMLLILGWAQAVGAEKPVLIIVDRSMSMRDNDQHNYSSDCAHLAVATLREGKPMALVGFASDAKTFLPWTELGGHTDRRDVRDNTIGRGLRYLGGSTNYVGAMEQAYNELTRRQAPAGSRVLFFTDGAPSNKPLEIEKAAGAFQQQGWVVDGLALTVGQDEMTEDLRRITEVTGGSYTEVSRAEDLVERFNALAASENDYFTLSVDRIDQNTPVQVLPGTKRLIWISVRDDAGAGAFIGLQKDGAGYSLAENINMYRYPEDFGDESNLQIINLSDPEPGTYTATYRGTPRSIYVNLSLPMFVDPLALPDRVREYDVITPGVRVVLHGRDNSVAEALKTAANVQAVITDSLTGTELARLTLPPTDDPEGLRYSAPWTVLWPTGIPKDTPRQYQVAYQIALSDQWTLRKQDAFLVDPVTGPPPASLTPAAEELNLPPSWTGERAEGQLPASGISISDPATVTLPMAAGFDVQLTGNSPDYRLQVGHRAAEPGYYQTMLGENASQGQDGELRMPLIPVRHDVYRYTGQRELVLREQGKTPVTEWIEATPDSAEQPFAGAEIPLTASDGSNAVLVLRPDGSATVQADAALKPGMLQGQGELRYGQLPPKALQVRMDYAPPAAGFSWPEQVAMETPAAARSWSEQQLPLRQEAGLPGAVSVSASDFVSDNGDVLLADYDLRLSVEPSHSKPGTELDVTISAFHGADLLPGTYTGTISVEHVADNGMKTTSKQAASIVVPAP